METTVDDLIGQLSHCSINKEWDLYYHDNGRWVHLLNITNDTPFSQIMAAIHSLKRKRVNFRLFEKDSEQQYGHSMYMAGNEKA